MRAFFGLILLSLSLVDCSDRKIQVKGVTLSPRTGELSLAVSVGAFDRVSELIYAGADVNENIGTDEKPVTPLMIALAGNTTQDDKTASYLIDHGADLEKAFPSRRGNKSRVRDWICYGDTKGQPARACIDAVLSRASIDDRDARRTPGRVKP